jgi:hypothetical protein
MHEQTVMASSPPHDLRQIDECESQSGILAMRETSANEHTGVIETEQKCAPPDEDYPP